MGARKTIVGYSKWLRMSIIGISRVATRQDQVHGAIVIVTETKNDKGI